MPQPLRVVYAKLGKKSVDLIEEVDSLDGIIDPPRRIVVECKQVPADVEVGDFVLIWLGSDNREGQPTTWIQGLKALGRIESKEGGPGWQDDWALTLTVGVGLRRPLEKKDFLTKTPRLYGEFFDLPMVSINSTAAQTFQLPSSDGEGTSEPALMRAIATVFPEFETHVRNCYPDLAVLFDRDVFRENLASYPAGRDPSAANSQAPLPTMSILYGPPGTGKTRLAKMRAVEIIDGSVVEPRAETRFRELEREGRIIWVTFHPTVSYEDFVEGYRPSVSDSGDLIFEPVHGPFRRACDAAADGPAVLVIDEINRADLSRVMGELVTLLEVERRRGMPEETSATLTYSQDVLTVPRHLSLVGTMNTADRSLSVVDFALRRRFDFEEVPPDAGLLSTWAGIELPKLLSVWNQRISVLRSRELCLGHSHLLSSKIERSRVERGYGDDEDGKRKALAWILRSKLAPLVLEYFVAEPHKAAEIFGAGTLLVPADTEDSDAFGSKVGFESAVASYVMADWWNPEAPAWDSKRFADQLHRGIGLPLASDESSVSPTLARPDSETDDGPPER